MWAVLTRNGSELGNLFEKLGLGNLSVERETHDLWGCHKEFNSFPTRIMDRKVTFHIVVLEVKERARVNF